MSDGAYTPRFVIVVELDQGMPRRDPQKPHLYVGLTVEDVEVRFEKLRSGRASSQFNGHFVRLRRDLNQLDGIELHPDKARDALAREKKRLAQLVYAINGIAKVWNCYVVDLEPPTGMTRIGAGYVYVGQSEHSPEERFNIHKGPKPAAPKRDLRSRIVRRRGQRLNYELMKSLEPRGPFYTQEEALEAEKTWAWTLHQRGFRVEAGDATPRATEGMA